MIFNIKMRYLHYLPFLLIYLVIMVQTANCDQEQQEEFDWAILLQQWEKYLSYPSSENARQVSALLPDTFHVRYTNSEQESEVLETIFKTLHMLEYQVYASDRDAVRLSFHLMTIADGLFAETLDIILGALIRINPKLFLEELKYHRYLCVGGLSHLIGNFGWEYVDKPAARRLEANLRIEALKEVTDPALLEIRDECIKELDSFYED